VTRLARAFIAVTPPDAALDALAPAVRTLADAEPHLRWLPRAQWHITLQFLGPVPDAERTADAIRAALATIAPFTIYLAGAGAFPTSRRGSVLWVGVQPDDQLRSLAAAVSDSTRELGFPTEDRPFHPHLTVARASRPRNVTGLVATLDDQPAGPAWAVRDIGLVASDTRPSGAIHTRWATLPLAAQGA
jgi:2'-5' RNA ligase